MEQSDAKKTIEELQRSAKNYSTKKQQISGWNFSSNG